MLVTKKDEFLDTDALAAILGLSPGTLRTWRWLGAGPKFHRLNGIAGPVRYRRDDIESWLDGQAIDPARKVKNKKTRER
ncbi:MAG: helix-turn-helix domain-containing protein [Nitrospinae bacterium]|nr:helix-turn-helix domain-containing protein [Nitrospinota bacterium]